MKTANLVIDSEGSFYILYPGSKKNATRLYLRITGTTDLIYRKALNFLQRNVSLVKIEPEDRLDVYEGYLRKAGEYLRNQKGFFKIGEKGYPHVTFDFEYGVIDI